jgi:cation diffusion facilitator CzcD-associated flavoprotein CzcO
MPRDDRPTSDSRRHLYRRVPLLQRLHRQWLFGVAEARFVSFSNERARQLAEKMGRQHLEAQISDPALQKQLTPTYRAGCKRILVSDDYYPALTQPNVELVTQSITAVTERGVVTADGQEREFDVLIAGTGFDATHPPVARLIHGRGGRSLLDAWTPHMEALHGTMVAGFPNFFLIVGPNTALGHNSIVYIAEAQMDYILRALRYMDGAHLLSLEASPEAQAAYNAALQGKLDASVWVQGGCTSFYLDAQGRNSTLWPERAARFRQLLGTFDPSLYRERLSPRRLPELLGT